MVDRTLSRPRFQYFRASSRSLSPTSPQCRALYRLAHRIVVQSLADVSAVDDMMTGEYYSWQDVYSSYGCSLELEASDDDG